MSTTDEKEQTVPSAVDTPPVAAPRVSAPPIKRRWIGNHLLRHLLMAAVAGLVIAGLTEVLEPFRNYQLATVAAYLCAAAGLTMLTGQSGQLSLGHGALMATGAYAAVLTANELDERGIAVGYQLLIVLASAVVAAMIVGVLVGAAATRLRGPYLAGATLALTMTVPSVTTTFGSVLGGDMGLFMPTEPIPTAIASNVTLEQWQVLVCWTVALLTMVVLANIGAGRFGRMMRAVRDDEVGARLSGINIPRTQTIAFTISAGAAGAGGGLMAFLTQSAAPGAFAMTLSLFLLMAIVIGGIGRLAGAVWGAVLLVALPDVTGKLAHSFNVGPELARRLDGNLSLAVFGVVLIAVMLLAPSGITGLTDKVTRRFRLSPRTRKG